MASFVFQSSQGFPTPLGATQLKDGINFALFSKHANSVVLSLFSPDNLTTPQHEIALEAANGNKTGDIWHIMVKGTSPYAYYMFRLDGAKVPPLHFEPQKFMLDPYAKNVLSHN